MKAWQCFLIAAPLWSIAAQIAAQSNSKMYIQLDVVSGGFFWLGVCFGLFAIINAAIESNKGKP